MWNNPQAEGYDDDELFGSDTPPPAAEPPAHPQLQPQTQPEYYAAADAGTVDPYAEVTWTPDQLQRMEGEWRRLQRAFAYHPHVTLTPLRGDPPVAYQVDYRLTTLIVNPRTNQLEYVANATVQVTLPPGFPEDPPAVKPITPIFHPNVSYDGLYIEGLWHPNETLLGLIRKVGDVLAYRSYDPDYAVNPAATNWMAANHQSLPLDQQANLSPTAGGEPLGRICRYGPKSLDSMRQSVLATQSALLGATPPDKQTIRDYSHKTQLALNLFLEKDVPDELQSQASELEQAARELLDLMPLCDYLRERRKVVSALRQVAKQLAASVQPLDAEVNKLIALVDAGDPTEPMVALKLIPEAGKLQPLQMAIPKLIAEAEKRIGTIRSGLNALASVSVPAIIPPDSLLGKRLERELTTGTSDVELVKQETAAAQAAMEPVLKRAQSEGQALDFVARWREYMDMATKARGIERQIREWGSEGIQAYYIENEGGRYGPFQFEQSVDLGAGDLLVRSLGGKAFEVRDPKADKALGQTKNGTLVLNLPAPDAGESDPETGEPTPRAFATRFTATERCDDLIVLLEFLRRSTIETVQKFAAYSGSAHSWAGKVCRLLAVPEVKKGLEDELARIARRWRHTIHDLHGLSPWKERLATYFLVHRCSETIPGLVATVTDRKGKHKTSKKRVNDIMEKCSRDVETGRMIIPPRYAKQYAEEQKLQEECATTVKGATTLLKSLAQQLIARLQDPRLLGKADLPKPRAVPALPETLASLPLMDGQIGNLVAPMEELIQAPLGGPPPQVAEPAPAEAAYTEAASQGGEYEQGGEYGYAAEGEGSYAGEAGQYAAEGDSAEGGEADAGEAYAGENGDACAAEGAAPQAEGVEQVDAESEPEWEDEQTPPASPPAVTSAQPTDAAEPAAAPKTPQTAAPGAVEASSSHAPESASPPAAPQLVAGQAESQWFIEEDDTSVELGASQIEQSDVAFGFDPEPRPMPPAAQSAHAKK